MPALDWVWLGDVGAAGEQEVHTQSWQQNILEHSRYKHVAWATEEGVLLVGGDLRHVAVQYNMYSVQYNTVQYCTERREQEREDHRARLLGRHGQ